MVLSRCWSARFVSILMALNSAKLQGFGSRHTVSTLRLFIAMQFYGDTQDQPCTSPKSFSMNSSQASLFFVISGFSAWSSLQTLIFSCTSRGWLSPTTVGTSSSIAFLYAKPKAMFGKPPSQFSFWHVALAVFDASRNFDGAGCHEGGEDVSKPILIGEAAMT